MRCDRCHNVSGMDIFICLLSCGVLIPILLQTSHPNLCNPEPFPIQATHCCKTWSQRNVCLCNRIPVWSVKSFPDCSRSMSLCSGSAWQIHAYALQSLRSGVPEHITTQRRNSICSRLSPERVFVSSDNSG